MKCFVSVLLCLFFALSALAEPLEPPTDSVLPAGSPAVVGETLSVENDVWKDRAVERSEGFNGPAARVRGHLTLIDTSLGGRPAEEADLTDWFELETGGVITARASSGGLLALDASSLCLTEEGRFEFSVTYGGEAISSRKPDWSSSNGDAISVSDGRIRAKRAGTAVITAVYGEESVSCRVAAVRPYRAVRVEKVDFGLLYVTMNPGDRYPTNVTFSPADTTETVLGYETSDGAVAEVDAGGVITAIGVGTATITAVSRAREDVRNTCRVCVIEPGSPRMAGLTIGVNPGHQRHTMKEKLPIAPWSTETAYAVKEGACGKFTGVPEYETNLQIGLKLARILTEQGAAVVITRTSNDVSLTNIDRATMLNEAHVDVALQLHCNSVDSSKKQGNSGYIRTTGDWVEESRQLSDCITTEISRVTGAKNLGVKIGEKYMSLNYSQTPSVLLEMGYLSNREEDELLATDAYREKLAFAICEGLCRYFGR